MKISRFLLAFIVFLALYQFTGAVGGLAGKLRFVLIVVVISILVSMAIAWFKRGSGAELRESGSSPPIIDVEEIIEGPRLTGIWRIVDALFGIIAAFGPPLLLGVIRGEPLSWDGSFTGQHFLAMVLGVGLYLVFRAWLWRRLTR